MKEKLLGKTPAELREIALSLGLKAFVGDQLCSWMYSSRVRSFDDMKNISSVAKSKLSEKYTLGLTPYAEVFTSKDGTKKYLFGKDEEVCANLLVEAVVIPSEDRQTLCVSCQRGCKMGCRFCMTGRQGFHGNLDVAEILSQFIAIDECKSLTNAVFMGMGEPMDNYDNVLRAIEVLTAPWGFGWSPKRITLSTVGVIPGMKRFLEDTQVHLAVSLHNAREDEREEMMPVQKAYRLKDVIDLIKLYDWSGQRRVSFEYTMFSKWNDDKA
ncbi:MAG: radical SAM protein, partial [Bacteroidales bacterium]|nr:radical SAM protein [Bacteroidales bacterium]